MPGRGLKILGPAGLHRFGRFVLLAAEVFQVGLAIAATNDVQVELDVSGMPFVERAEQVAAELLAGWATEALPPPDFADAVHPRIAAAVDQGQLPEQIGPRAQLGLDRGGR